MVGISYTGVNGDVHTFNVESAEDAFGRLMRIPGYGLQEGDKLAAGLTPTTRVARGSIWAKKKAKAEAFRNRSFTSPTAPNSVSRGLLGSSPSTSVRLAMTDKKKDGVPVATREQEVFVSSDGKVALGRVIETPIEEPKQGISPTIQRSGSNTNISIEAGSGIEVSSINGKYTIKNNAIPTEGLGVKVENKNGKAEISADIEAKSNGFVKPTLEKVNNKLTLSIDGEVEVKSRADSNVVGTAESVDGKTTLTLGVYYV